MHVQAPDVFHRGRATVTASAKRTRGFCARAHERAPRARRAGWSRTASSRSSSRTRSWRRTSGRTRRAPPPRRWPRRAPPAGPAPAAQQAQVGALAQALSHSGPLRSLRNENYEDTAFGATRAGARPVLHTSMSERQAGNCVSRATSVLSRAGTQAALPDKLACGTGTGRGPALACAHGAEAQRATHAVPEVRPAAPDDGVAGEAAPMDADPAAPGPAPRGADAAPPDGDAGAVFCFVHRFCPAVSLVGACWAALTRRLLSCRLRQTEQCGRAKPPANGLAGAGAGGRGGDPAAAQAPTGEPAAAHKAPLKVSQRKINQVKVRPSCGAPCPRALASLTACQSGRGHATAALPASPGIATTLKPQQGHA